MNAPRFVLKNKKALHWSLQGLSLGIWVIITEY